jgi:hypothetical protein
MNYDIIMRRCCCCRRRCCRQCHKVVSVGLSCKVVRSCPNFWNHISCSRSSSYKMLRCRVEVVRCWVHAYSFKLRAWCPGAIVQICWGLDALELLLNYVGGLMPWSFCSIMLRAWCPGAFLRSIMLRAWCPGLVPHAFAYQDDLRWVRVA